MISEISAKMQHLFDETPVILYVGRKGNLNDALIRQRWSMVITTLIDDNFPNAFNKEGLRRTFIIDTEDSIKNIRLNTRDLPVMLINGSKSYFDNSKGSFDLEADFDQTKEALVNSIYSAISSNFASLVIIGYDSNDPLEISIKSLYTQFRHFAPGTVLFFDSTDLKDNQRIAQLQCSGIVDVVPYEPQAVFEHEDFNTYDFQSDVQEYTPLFKSFYVNHKRVQIQNESLFEIDGYCSLLSLEDLQSINVPKQLEFRWFFQFLQLSAKQPQWYGYSPNLQFSITRDFYTSLYDITNNCLEKKTKVNEKEEERAILLSGQTGSGKSIALSKLAYQVFFEKKYPVLFIYNPDINLSEGSPALIALDRIIMELENFGAEKVLIIWDLSIYNCSKNNYVTRALNALINRGRKVVIICSAMNQPDELFEKSEKINNIIKTRRYYVVNSPICLNSNEKASLKQLLLEKGRISSERVDWYFSHEDDPNLLSLLYQLFLYMHPQLCRGLYREIYQSVFDVREQIINLPRPQSELTAIGLELVRLGLSTLSDSVPDENRGDEAGKDFELFCNCLAVGSQFKIGTPMSFAMRLLGTKIDSQNRKMKELVFSMPWLAVTPLGMDPSMFEFEISFRTPVEARMYLEEINCRAQQQLDVIVHIIKKLSDSKNQYFSDEIRYLERLIRMVGPNSDSSDVVEKAYYQKYYNLVINALAELRESGVYEPKIIVQEITLIREFYKNALDIGEKERCEQLIKAVKIARELMATFEKGNPVGEIQSRLYNSIVVENANCEYELRQLTNKQEQISCYSSYGDIYHRLYNVIALDPNDSYPYTALFKWFLEEYSSDSIRKEVRMEYLSEIIELIEGARMIKSEGIDHNEAQAHISRIYKLIGGKEEQGYFEELCRNGFASGVYMRAIIMLEEKSIKISNLLKIGDSDETVFESIVALFEKYHDITINHSGCQRLLLQIKWLLYNKELYFIDERKTTAMSFSQWHEIGQICSNYISKFVMGGQRIQGAYVYYYLLALSKAQLDDYLGALEILKTDTRLAYPSQSRIKVWYLLCDEKGKPKHFSGRLELNRYNKQERTGHLSISGYNALNNVYYFLPNMRSSSVYNQTFDNIVLGMNFLGFNAFRGL